MTVIKINEDLMNGSSSTHWKKKFIS